MNNLVVTLETAQKLKAAGFPQSTNIKWSASWGEELEYTVLPWGIEVYLEYGVIAAPTAQEIADQLPRGIDLFKNVQSNDWQVICGFNGHYKIYGDTMAEALALLWLKLQERKTDE